MLGEACCVMDGAIVSKTIVGARSIIGNKSSVIESHLWEGCVIESNCIINSAIICNDVVIKFGSTIPRGCIICSNVIIDNKMLLKEYTRVSLKVNSSNPKSDSELSLLLYDVISINENNVIYLNNCMYLFIAFCKI